MLNILLRFFAEEPIDFSSSLSFAARDNPDVIKKNVVKGRRAFESSEGNWKKNEEKIKWMGNKNNITSLWWIHLPSIQCRKAWRKQHKFYANLYSDKILWEIQIIFWFVGISMDIFLNFKSIEADGNQNGKRVELDGKLRWLRERGKLKWRKGKELGEDSELIGIWIQDELKLRNVGFLDIEVW
jgi:hypothetical protein